MRHCFDLTEINAECRLYKMLAVACSGRLCYICLFGHFRIYVFYYLNHGFERIAHIVSVVGIENIAVFIYKSSFCCGRACIYTKIAWAFGFRKFFYRDNRLCVSVAEFFKLLLVFEQGRKPFYLVYLDSSKRLKIVPQLVHRKLLTVFRKRCAHSDKQICVGREHYMFIVKL